MVKPEGLSALYKPFGLRPHGLYRADNPSGFTTVYSFKKPQIFVVYPFNESVLWTKRIKLEGCPREDPQCTCTLIQTLCGSICGIHNEKYNKIKKS